MFIYIFFAIFKCSKIHLNRIGTNPFEHSFGVVRMHSKNHHNAKRFIEEVNNINPLRKMREEMALKVVRHRKLQFGRAILNEKTQIKAAYISQCTDALVNEGNTEYCKKMCKQKHSYFNRIIERNAKSKNYYIFCKNLDVMLSPTSNILIQKPQFQMKKHAILNGLIMKSNFSLN